MALNVGEWIFVGGDTTLSKFAGNDAGYARIGSIAAHKLVLDFTTFTPVADAGATVNQKVRIFFGKVLVNASDASGVKRRSFTFERQLGNDGDGFQSELIKGCIPNELTINVPQADKMNADLSFVGLEHADRTGLEGPISKDKTFVSPLGEAAYNTSRDLYSLKLYMVDATTTKPTSLFAYATDLKLTVNNNVTAKKALGVLGAFDANTGIFAVSGTCSAYFATIAATKAIINNSDVGLNAIFAHENCGMVFDLPLLTIGGGLNKIEKDKPVMVDLDQDAVKCSKGYTLLVTNFEYLPTAAMPA
jgi:hypothetical protein